MAVLRDASGVDPRPEPRARKLRQRARERHVEALAGGIGRQRQRVGCPGGIAQPGNYAAAITLGNNATCVFQSGIYILNHGITFGNGAAISTAAGGALLYFPNEPLSGGNNGVTLDDATLHGDLSITAGSGDDTVQFLGNTSVAGDQKINLGGGNNTPP